MKILTRKEFRLPITSLLLLAAGAFFTPFWMLGIAIGIGKIAIDSFHKIREGEYSLDYIAFLAMVVSLFAAQYLAGAVVALMIIGGEALDEYASARAESALKGLAERIPKSCVVRLPDGSTAEKAIQDVREGEVIVVRPNELIPLDGTLRSDEALLNEANLTGEAMPVSFHRGTFIKSGSVNVGETLELAVEGGFETSTYMRIVRLVDDAKQHQAPVVRLAERVSFPFTAIALALSAGAYLLTGEMWRALAVLVIATPCPLIIAAPVAFIGGLSRAARHDIIVKRTATLEALTRVRHVFFDKTGTLTLGEPTLTDISIAGGDYTQQQVLSIASAIEFHSIHPLARAILRARREKDAPVLEARHVAETIGKGIAGDVDGERYTIAKAPDTHGIVLALSKAATEIARFTFEDELKQDVEKLFAELRQRNISVTILTGDKYENAERLFGKYGVEIKADLSPEMKYSAIEALQKGGALVAMVGDGLNDAPALAKADVGIVFSGTENSAAIEAADAVVLGRHLGAILDLFGTSTRAMRVASQSIWGGVTLSVIGMIAASLGFVPPVAGAVIQEVIDVVVILNSLRAAR